MIVVFVAYCLAFLHSTQALNNACTNYPSYYTIYINPFCYNSYSVGHLVPEIAQHFMGACETHNPVTEDGYILTLFRIPKNNRKGVVLLHHPAFTDSSIYVNQDEESTALLFWNAGYEVWIANNRGTFYSQKHVNLTTSDKKYWEFSFHEIGYYDYKANIDYILHTSNVSRIIFIGHSIGTTGLLVYSSLRPVEAQKKIQVGILMAPVSSMENPKGAFAILTTLPIPILQLINTLLRNYSLLTYIQPILPLLRDILIFLPFKFLYVVINALGNGFTPRQFDPKLIDQFIYHFPSDLSARTFYHYLQTHQNKRFSQYDFGASQNVQKYGGPQPPLYPLENITLPLYLIHSKDDWISTPKDVDIIKSQLSVQAKKYGSLQIEGLNHLDFHYGRDRKTKIYDNILYFLTNVL